MFNCHISPGYTTQTATTAHSPSLLFPQGIPQGSVLGPTLSILYVPLVPSSWSLLPLLRRWRQIVQFLPNSSSLQLSPLWPAASTKWNHGCRSISSNYTVINQTWLSSAPHTSPKPWTTSTSPLWNLVSIFNSNLSFEKHVNHIRTAFIDLKNVARLHPSLSAAETLIQAFISSRMDYRNSVLYGTSSINPARNHRMKTLTRVKLQYSMSTLQTASTKS